MKLCSIVMIGSGLMLLLIAICSSGASAAATANHVPDKDFITQEAIDMIIKSSNFSESDHVLLHSKTLVSRNQLQEMLRNNGAGTSMHESAFYCFESCHWSSLCLTGIAGCKCYSGGCVAG